MRGIIISLSFLLLIACSEEKAKPSLKVAPVLVEIEMISSNKINSVQRYAGITKPLSKFKVIPEVTGVIVKKHVRAGDKVKSGQVLFEIDPEPFEIAVITQESLLKQAKAELSYADIKLEMSDSLANSNVMSKVDSEQIRVNREVKNALVAKAKADLLSAKLNLKQSKVTSSIDGIAGISSTNVGDLVSPLYGELVEITASNIMEVFVQINAQEHFDYLLELRKDSSALPDTLEIEFRDGSIYPHSGTIDYIANEVAQASGTVSYRLVFPNPDNILLGGQNVSVLATAKKASNIVSVPQKSVQEDQSGRFVLVLDDDNIVAKRYLTFGDRFNDRWTVKKGLSNGDRIVVVGLLKAKIGQPVTPTE